MADLSADSARWVTGYFTPEMLSYEMPFTRQTAMHARRRKGGLNRAGYWRTKGYIKSGTGAGRALGYPPPLVAGVVPARIHG